MILTTHLQTVRLSDASLGHFPTHPALVSDEAEVRYLREMMGVFLACVLPPEDSESAMFTSMTRELLTETIHRNINMLADYDYVNQVIRIPFSDLVFLNSKQFMRCSALLLAVISLSKNSRKSAVKPMRSHHNKQSFAPLAKVWMLRNARRFVARLSLK